MNSSPRSPNASGMPTAIKRLASITAIIMMRTLVDSGSNSFVVHVV